MQYEERLDAIIREVANNPEIIIYIDEIHNLVGNGSMIIKDLALKY